MQQVVDLQNDLDFQSLGVAVLSIAFDPAAEQAAGAEQFGITTVPMLVDGDHRVSERYGVLQWAVRSGEPGHTFILVDASGHIAWIRDYGAPQNGGQMYVPVAELASQIAASLNS
jgi:peroxiredoxin